jgi:hypothetical protein
MRRRCVAIVSTDISQRKTALAHVLWIGGAPDARKTTVARHLAERLGLQLYLLDAAQPTHWERSTPEQQPTLCAFQAMSMDGRWVQQTPEAMATQIMCIGEERLHLAVEDLLTLPKTPSIVAEGPWFFPELIAPLLSNLRQGIWLVPTEEFKRASAIRRNKPTIRHQTSDPGWAARNWLKRDMLLDAHVRRQTAAVGLRLVEVDGSRSVEQMVSLLEEHFHPLLTLQ